LTFLDLIFTGTTLSYNMPLVLNCLYDCSTYINCQSSYLMKKYFKLKPHFVSQIFPKVVFRMDLAVHVIYLC